MARDRYMNHDPDVCIYDMEDPDSIYNMVPESAQRGLRLINPDWVHWSEHTMIKKWEITDMDKALRFKFWDEYFHCKDKDRKKMSMAAVYKGVSNERYWREKILLSPRKMCFIMTMPKDYKEALRSLHYDAFEQMKQILDLPLNTPTAKLNSQLMAKKIDVFKYLDQRYKGAVVQKMQVEQKNLNVNVDGNQSRDVSPIDMDELDREIAKLEAGGNKLPAPPLDVTTELKETLITVSPETVTTIEPLGEGNE